ncbi:type II secretion system protein GspD [Trichlorobacter lovleyi]|uniref:Type II secretory pathway component PulD-like protein n=1 Tax=Trichlorobacter lovleyi (strain ATCC BAA-1151 / DSM 17278 / SZ) TaxID=398767 RepID=B3E5L7_TRIL1|nr:type II secretory pathway component PulD-like protein [Trichlorobacter lovleyi]ACD94688.1 Type II secretory pathway component PulD-like protein [Trichlorobacter lovleyi SZ]
MIRIRTMLCVALFSTLLLGGCSSIQQIRKDDLPTQHELAKKAESMLPAEPSIVRLTIPKNAFQVHETKPFSNDRYVSISMHNVEIRDFMKALAASTGLNIVYDMPDKNSFAPAYSQTALQQGQQPAAIQGSARSRMVSVSFNGRLSDLFKTLSDSTGYFFTFENGAIVMKERETFSVLVPNYPDLLKTVEGNMVKLGAEGVGYDDLSSSMSFRADYAGYQRMKEYLDNLKNNVSLVTMRIVLMNVRLNNGNSLGIDWSQMAVGWQSQNIQNLGFKKLAKLDDSSSSTGTTTGTTTTTTPATNLFEQGIGALFNTSGANLFMESSRFSLSALFSFMENFGKYNVMQNVFVETMSGKKGKIEIVTESPYVSEIGISSLSSTSGATAATAKTSTAKAGVIMDFTPYYNKKQQMLTINLKVNVEGVNRYVTISAGSQLGSFMQPETTKKSVETFLRMKPEQVAIIGGLVYEMNDDNVNGLPGDTYLTKNVTGKKEKEELVIVVKPTIIEFIPEG